MPRTLLGWSTLSGHLSEPPFTKSWIYPSCVSACWHVCLTTCVPVCTSEWLHVCVWMTACLHICIFAGLSLYPHVCISWCVHVCVSAWLHTCTCLLCVCVHEKARVLCLHVCVSGWLGKKTHCGLGLVMEVWHVALPCLLIFDPVVHTSRFFFFLLLSGSSWIWTLGKRRKIITYKKSLSDRGSYNHFRKHTILKQIY